MGQNYADWVSSSSTAFVCSFQNHSVLICWNLTRIFDQDFSLNSFCLYIIFLDYNKLHFTNLKLGSELWNFDRYTIIDLIHGQSPILRCWTWIPVCLQYAGSRAYMQLYHVLPLFYDQTSSSMRSRRQRVKTNGQPVSLQTIRHQVSISSLDSICFPYLFRCCSMRDIAPSLQQQSPRAGED